MLKLPAQGIMLIANARFRSTFATIMLQALLLLLVVCLPALVQAQEPDRAPKPPPPPPHDKPDGEHKPKYGSHRGPGGPGTPGSMGDWDKLTEAEKKRVREATELAWQKPEMLAAKEKFFKASEEFRAALRTTLQAIDPEVVTILEKVKPAGPWEFRGAPPGPPKPEDPDFVKQAIARLGFEMAAFGRPENRDAMRRIHDRLLDLPDVKAAITKLQAAPVGERVEAFKSVREVYRRAFEQQKEEYRKAHPKDEDKK